MIQIVEIEYYEDENGKIPVMDFLSGLPHKLKAKCLRDIDLLEDKGMELREPYVKPIQGIYELRTKYSTDITRIFYFIYVDNKFILLHGYLKKSRKTPKREIEKALMRKADYERRHKNDT